MRVTTIDGGFRGRRTSPNLRVIRGGIGSLATSVQNTEADAFNARFARFEAVWTALNAAMNHAAVSTATAAMLEPQFIAIGAERDAHVAALSSLANDAQLMEWRSTGDSIVAHAAVLADQTAMTIGFNEGVRPWQIGVALVGGAILFGGAAYLLSQHGR